MSSPYLISKAIDPIFAVSVGVAAAAVRINREEREKGRTMQQTLDALRRRPALVFGGAGKEAVAKTAEAKSA